VNQDNKGQPQQGGQKQPAQGQQPGKNPGQQTQQPSEKPGRVRTKAEFKRTRQSRRVLVFRRSEPFQDEEWTSAMKIASSRTARLVQIQLFFKRGEFSGRVNVGLRARRTSGRRRIENRRPRINFGFIKRILRIV